MEKPPCAKNNRCPRTVSTLKMANTLRTASASKVANTPKGGKRLKDSKKGWQKRLKNFYLPIDMIGNTCYNAANPMGQ